RGAPWALKTDGAVVQRFPLPGEHVAGAQLDGLVEGRVEAWVAGAGQGDADEAGEVDLPFFTAVAEAERFAFDPLGQAAHGDDLAVLIDVSGVLAAATDFQGLGLGDLLGVAAPQFAHGVE